ncbi:GntR family transcriptional regulator [Streptomyces sp. DSM 44917]|uniref:GntR family transcriptional regulator n=1 Tax=Streptomyces boetiae TaxID=3075541 RepID=A0ABU2L9I0_9ACTN|nr:GntR family transcriptional regulator [Streptomyces sp. DSM 44917]MDT0307987.1 GntR family transcriptional regulator [Streptomyces sp. DSM 44917]
MNAPANASGPAADRAGRASADAVIARLYTQLRDEIIDGRLAPGETLSQVQLARRLGASRTPLREALRLLEREGLIDSEFNRRVRVAGLSAAELEEIYASRLVLESLAVRLSVERFTAEDIDFLRARLEAMRQGAAAQDYERWKIPHRAFHARLRRGAGARLTRQLETLSDHAERYRHLYTVEAPRAWDAGLVEHGAIVEACRGGDAEAAADAVGRHLAHVALSTVALVQPDYDPAAIRQALKMVLRRQER